MLDHFGGKESESERRNMIDALARGEQAGIFNLITALTCKILAAPTSLITFVGQEKQVIYAKHNFPLDETPREDSFCRFVVDAQQTQVVNDARQDARFSQNPLVQGFPNIRFYAGTPLVTKNNIAIGSLCIIDYQPRTLNHHERERLEALGAMVTAFMQETHRLGLIDPVTLLPNRQRLYDELAELDERVPRYGLALVETTEIVRLYDTAKAFGIAMVEAHILAVAQRMREALGARYRLYSVAFGRFSILYDEKDTADLLDNLRRLRTALNAGYERFYTLTFELNTGLTRFDTATRPQPQQILRECMSALHDAVSSKQGVMRYHPDNDLTQQRLTTIVQDLTKRISSTAGFAIHYQPKLNLRTGMIESAEALIRWRHPQFGDISPAEFIPVAEKSGAISAITRWVLREVLKHMALWREQGCPLAVSVNVSVQDLASARFLRLMRELRKAYPQAAAQLECLETQEILHNERALTHLDTLKREGYRIAIDDFGAGYSNLGYLITIPADVIKIDRSLISNMAVDARNRVILTYLIKMLHDLHYQVIAEGVEDQETFDEVSALGFDGAQGFYISRPLPLAALGQYMATVGQPWRRETDAASPL
ncbi:GGDEF and EAL domain-containing protein [Candidatus Sodalis endolongispinus]|uniref:GGDEF and EAL domain-containing protein n=1 Tax=Candidatus Sodalis endolongispinus TaxID=2812662 RepID=A0ABS5YD44_9GAMM|nr:GGDEF and EAL domain-containing protein [Candidatus Sodalis endolongispinus]MBT9432908.1 GGDEF and EAL domain-containing protein [Candidatus Sodalis endolongispinus]